MIECGGIDLHMHTIYSDGAYTPQEILELSEKMSLRAISITDHDTAEGIHMLLQNKGTASVEVIPGIEITTAQHMHILGYYFDPEDPLLFRFRKDAVERGRRSILLLIRKAQKYGVPIDLKQIRNQYGYINTKSILSFATDRGASQFLLDELAEIQQNSLLTCEEVLLFLKSIHAVPVLAHPARLRMRRCELEQCIRGLVCAGLQGIECYHPDHTPDETKMYLDLAKSMGLCVTGGSDLHKCTYPKNFHVPYNILHGLKNAYQ